MRTGWRQVGDLGVSALGRVSVHLPDLSSDALIRQPSPDLSPPPFLTTGFPIIVVSIAMETV